MRIVFRLLAILAVTVYLIFSFTQWNKSNVDIPCVKTEIVITDSNYIGFIKKETIEKILKRNNLFLEDRLLKDINTRKIEEVLLKNHFIQSVICYKIIENDFYKERGIIKIEITQIHPVLHIMNNKDENYYIDAQKKIYPCLDYLAYLPIVTGYVNSKYAKAYLSGLGAYLREDPFWSNQIEQIDVAKDGTITCSTRVGKQLVYLGKPVNLEKKLDRLKRFYKQGLSVVGWNKYGYLNLEFNNQIIATKNN